GVHRGPQLLLRLPVAAVRAPEKYDRSVRLTAADGVQRGRCTAVRGAIVRALVATLEDGADAFAGLQPHALRLLVRVRDPAQVAHREALSERRCAASPAARYCRRGHREPPRVRSSHAPRCALDVSAADAGLLSQ